MKKLSAKSPAIPYRQIRANYDDKTITVYQAYSKEIATLAVTHQKLSASSAFSYERMTWIKPSFCWMMYRSGYAMKDNRQTNILAIKMTHAKFRELLMQAAVCGKGPLSVEDRSKNVRVQWDPERGPELEERDYRSLQVGIGRGVSREWVEKGIVEIRDVTEMARKLRERVESWEGGDWDIDELVREGCLPEERVYEVEEGLRKVLKMEFESG